MTNNDIENIKYDGHGNPIRDDDEILEPTMNVFSGTAMVVGLMIGSGIFSTPGSVWELVGSPGMAMVLWVVGGLVTYAGTFAYIELGTMLPKSGGEQAYLEYAFKRPKALFAFLFCIAMIICIRPGAAAADSTIFGSYLIYASYGPKDLVTDPFVRQNYDWISRGLGLLCITTITLLNMFSVVWSIRVHDVLTTVKVLVLLTISITGLVVISGGAPNVPNPHNFQNPFANTKADGHAFAQALFKIFWAYDGWNNLNYSVGELKNPKKNLPIAAGLGVTIVTILYLLANLAYLFVVPEAVAFASREILAGNFFEIVFGQLAGRVILPIFIAFSAYGAVSAMVFSVSRVTFVAAKEGYLPFSSFFGAINRRFKTPINALIFNWFWTVLLIMAPPPGEAFSFLVDLVGYPTWLFYGISVIGLIVMRYTEPKKERPFKVWIPVAIFFILVAIFLCVFPFVPPTEADPNASSIPFYLSALLGLIISFIPFPLWYVMIIHHGSFKRAMRKLRGFDVDREDDEKMARQAKRWTRNWATEFSQQKMIPEDKF